MRQHDMNEALRLRRSVDFGCLKHFPVQGRECRHHQNDGEWKLRPNMRNCNGDESQVREAVMEQLTAHFKPEFLNRIDDIVIFHQLSREQIAQIIDVQLERLRVMLAERNIHLELDDAAKALLAREGYDPHYGARPLKRAIQTMIQNPLAVKLLSGDVLPGQTVKATASGDKIAFKVEAAAAAA